MIRWRDCARNRDRQRQQERVLSTPSHFVFIDQDAEIGTGIRKLLLNKTCGIDGSRRSGARTAALLVLLHRLCRHLSFWVLSFSVGARSFSLGISTPFFLSSVSFAMLLSRKNQVWHSTIVPNAA
jgi:hypothetical protein